MGETITIDAERFTPESWAEFGWVPVADDDPNEGMHTLEFSWQDAHLNYITHTPAEVERDAIGWGYPKTFAEFQAWAAEYAVNGIEVGLHAVELYH